MATHPHWCCILLLHALFWFLHLLLASMFRSENLYQNIIFLYLHIERDHHTVRNNTFFQLDNSDNMSNRFNRSEILCLINWINQKYYFWSIGSIRNTYFWPIGSTRKLVLINRIDQKMFCWEHWTWGGDYKQFFELGTSRAQMTTGEEKPYTQLTGDGFGTAVASFTRERWTESQTDGFRESWQPLWSLGNTIIRAGAGADIVRWHQFRA